MANVFSDDGVTIVSNLDLGGFKVERDGIEIEVTEELMREWLAEELRSNKIGKIEIMTDQEIFEESGIQIK